MISRSLFFKLQKEDLKRRLWTIPLAIIVFFLSYPITYAITLSNMSNVESSYTDIVRTISQLAGTTYPMGMMITVIGAVICGMSGFYYLHSKKKIDFFHSIPIRREGLFAIHYINGILIYLVPYIVNMILSILILQINGYMNTTLLSTIGNTIIVNTIFYLLTYTIVIVAMMLTGNIIVSCFGTGVFFLYGPLLQIMKEMLFQEFFQTYYGNGKSVIEQLQFLSPLGIYYKTAIKVNGSLNKGNLFSLLVVLIVTLILIGGALFFYIKRPSEAASKAMAFTISEPIIKFALVVALSLGGGLIFRGLTYESSGGWFLFGIIISLIIIYGVIEAIYNFDIKCMFRHRLQLLACLGITLVIAGIFQFDLFRYDSYLPKKSEIASMSIHISGLEENISYVDKTTNEWGVGYYYVGSNEYQLEQMGLTDYQDAYTLAMIGSKKAKTTDFSNYSTPYTYYNIKYQLKNGREIYRRYGIPNEDALDIVKELYMNPEYKEAHYPIFSWDGTEIMDIGASNIFGYKNFNLDLSAKKELLESLKKDLLQFTIDELVNTKPVATLFLQYGKYNTDYFIYPSFKHTIAILEKRGFDTTRQVEVSDIIEIQMEHYSSNEDHRVTYTNKKELAEIFPHLVTMDYVWNNSIVYDVDYSVRATVRIRVDQYGNEVTVDYYFRTDTIPDFVKEDIQYKAQE